MTFWAVVITIALLAKLVRLLLGQLLENLGYCLFQHLVTLLSSEFAFKKNEA